MTNPPPHSLKARLRKALAVLSLSAAFATPLTGYMKNETDADQPILLNPDTGWCWFQDERVLIDRGHLLLAGVGSEGDITVTRYEIDSGKTEVVVLHERLQANDHAVPGLMILPDGRILAVYSQHNGPYTRWRITREPGNFSDWEPEQQFDNGARTTYSNLYRLSEEGENGRIYNFTRTREWDPNFIVSDDAAAGWRYGGRLIDGGGSGQRPYPRYTGNGKDEIHFITTEHHPRNFANSIYHGFIRGGKARRSDGSVVDEDIFREEAPQAEAFSKVFHGDEDNVAWTSDIELDSRGHPYIAYSVTKDRIAPGEGGMDHRYRYARWDGESWSDYEIAYAGTRLYPREDHYTGLIALHPKNPDIVFISADVDPATGEPIRVNGEQRYEIFKGVTSDRGQTWQWTPVTKNSPQDNLRPMVAAGEDVWAVVWLRGDYRTYTDYNQEAVGLFYSD